MANSSIQVAPDSTGKKLQTFQNVVGGNTVEAEAVALVDTTGAAITTLPVSLASVPSHAVTIPIPAPVSDNAGSLTVDAPVGTPVNTRLSDGAANYDATKTG